MSTEQLVKALEGLEKDASRRQEYNTWLQEFRRGTESWQVSYEILESDSYPRNLKIFCAQTLRNKIIYDLHQVPRESRMHLKDQVLVLFERNMDLLTVVGAQLCVALAAFAMQVAEWEHPVQELMARFESAEMVPLLFEFLKVIPEEFNSSRSGMVDPSLRLKKTETLIQDTAPLVLNFMLKRADIMSQSGSMQCLFFETLKPWLNEVDLPDIIASPLVDWMLASIDNMDARTAAVDCLISVLRETSDVGESHVQEAIKYLYPKLMRVAQVYENQYEDNPDLHRDLTRLFSEAAEAWHVLICRNPDGFLPVLEAVKVCIATCNGDLEVVEFTFDVFDKIRTMVGEPMPGSAPPPTEIPREPFHRIFLEIFLYFTKLLQFPESFYGNLEEEEFFRDFRYDIGDMLKICSSIAGHEEVLRLSYENLRQLQQPGVDIGWQASEALLFAVRAVARTVPNEENVWLPKIFETFQTLPLINQEHVKHAALMLLGRYSTWSSMHPQYLGFELDYILTSLWSPSFEVSQAAAHAFLYLCTDASYELVPFLPQIMEQYTALIGKAELESLCKFCDGVGAVINHLKGEDQASAIRYLFKPVQDRAMMVQSGGCPHDFILQVAYDIQALGCAIAMISAPPYDPNSNQQYPLVVEIQRLHPLLMAIWSAYGANSDVLLEGIARYYIRALFNLDLHLYDELPLLLENSMNIITVEPMSAVLFELGSSVVQSFHPDEPKVYPELLPLVWQFSRCMCTAMFGKRMSDMLRVQGEIVDQITLLSQVIHHGFHFLCDLSVAFRDEFFNTMLTPSVLLSIQVFEMCWDSEALTAVGHLYDDIERFLPFGPDPVVNYDILGKISKVFEAHGFAFVHALFYWFLLRPDVHFESLAEHLVDLAFRLAPKSSVVWLQKLLGTLPAGTISDEEKIVFSQSVFQILGNQRFIGIGFEMNNFMKAYSARNLKPRT